MVTLSGNPTCSTLFVLHFSYTHRYLLLRRPVSLYYLKRNIWIRWKNFTNAVGLNFPGTATHIPSILSQPRRHPMSPMQDPIVPFISRQIMDDPEMLFSRVSHISRWVHSNEAADYMRILARSTCRVSKWCKKCLSETWRRYSELCESHCCKAS